MIDGPGQEVRDKTMAAATEMLERAIVDGDVLLNKPKADMHAPYPGPESTMWLWGYDAIQEARDYLATLTESETQSTRG